MLQLPGQALTWPSLSKSQILQSSARTFSTSLVSKASVRYGADKTERGVGDYVGGAEHLRYTSGNFLVIIC